MEGENGDTTTDGTKEECTQQESPLAEDPRKPPTFESGRKKKTSRRSKQKSTALGLQDPASSKKQVTMESFMKLASTIHQHGQDALQEERLAETQQPQTADISADIMPKTPDSEQDFTMGGARVGTGPGDADLPIQVGQWLDSFQGKEVEVAANGQCAFLALYASTTNHDGSKLNNSKTTIRDSTELKRAVYSLMMVNLRRDVALQLVNPHEECAKLYPDHPGYNSTEAATAALFTHYNTARNRSAGKQVPPSFWAGPHELRAMAQYLRDPILVLDANSHKDAHIQRYFYKQFRLGDGSDHESGYGEQMTDREARDYLESCWALHVLPTILILRHHERHFYGVSHGELFLKWRAEGDQEFAANLPDAYTWKATMNHLTETESNVDLSTINQLADREEVNNLLIKRCEMRMRLDIVHARCGLPILNSTRDTTVDEEDIMLEEKNIRIAYGMDDYAALSQSTDDSNGAQLSRPQRHSRIATGDIIAQTYFRILRDSDEAPMDDVDKPLADLIASANQDAFTKWCSFFRDSLHIPAMKRRRSKPADMRAWLSSHPEALRHLFAFLPYPEYEAKSWRSEYLAQWGAQEVYREQIGALQRIIADDETADTPKAFCQEWLTACTDSTLHYSTAQTLANSADRWARLAQWVPTTSCRAHPKDIKEDVWHILHVVPYIVGSWASTPMGRAAIGARVAWYNQFPFIRTLCHNILEFNDFSAAIFAPTGDVWEDQSESDLTDPSPAQHY